MSAYVQSPVVIGIHGVGNPGVGEIGRAILSNLQQAPIQCDVIEINWNRLTDRPLSSEGTLNAKAVGILQTVLTGASSLASDTLDAHLKGGKLGRVWDLQKYLFSCAGLTITFAFALIIASPAILFCCAGVALSIGVEPSSLIDRAFPVIVRSLAVITGGTISCLLGYLLCSLLCVLSAAPRELFLVSVRRAVMLSIKLPIFVIVSPLLIPWRKVAKALTSPFGRFGPILAVFSAFRGLVTLAAGTTYLVFLSGPVIKILLDIFRYVADPAYRNRILEELGSNISRMRSNTNSNACYIVAHSLGSVIALDALLNLNCFSARSSITLVTLGSPLRRFFFRFFPNLFFPNSANDCAVRLAERFERFRWINCYRPFDQVGARLNLPGWPWLAEISTRQFGKIFGAHPNYWSDHSVRDCVLRCLNEVSFNYNANPSCDVTHVPQRLEVMQSQANISKKSWRMTLGIMLIAAQVSVIISSAKLNQDSIVAFNAKKERTNLLGRKVEGNVDYTRSCSDVCTDTIILTFEDEAGLVRRVVKTDSPSPQKVQQNVPWRTTFDIKRLAQVASQNQNRLSGISIKYLQEDPDFVVLPDYPLSWDLLQRSQFWFVEIIVVGVLFICCIGISFLTYVLGDLIFKSFTGEKYAVVTIR